MLSRQKRNPFAPTILLTRIHPSSVKQCQRSIASAWPTTQTVMLFRTDPFARHVQRKRLCSAKTSAAIMRHSFPMSIRDEVHTKCPALGSDNQVAPCTGAVEDMTTVSRQMFQELQAPSWSAGVLCYSEPPKLQEQFIGDALFSAGDVFLHHASDELADFLRQRRSTATRFPAPVELEALAMPTDERLRGHNGQRLIGQTL
jgi:hypothetical protein